MIGYCPSAGRHPATSSTFVFNRFHRPLRKSAALARHARVSPFRPHPPRERAVAMVHLVSRAVRIGINAAADTAGGKKREGRGKRKKRERKKKDGKKREKEKKEGENGGHGKLCPRRGRTTAWPDRFIAATSRISHAPRFFSSLFANSPAFDHPLSLSLSLSLFRARTRM